MTRTAKTLSLSLPPAVVEQLEARGKATRRTAARVAAEIVKSAVATSSQGLSTTLVCEAAHAVSFPCAAIPTTLRVSAGEHPDDTAMTPRLYVTLNCPHRFEASAAHVGPVTLQVADDVPAEIETRAQAIAWIYDRVRAAWIHELNEALHLDGVRRRDLHWPDGKTVDLVIVEKELPR